MNEEKLSHGTGLQELPIDTRDFSFEQTFGSVALSELSKTDFFVSEPLEIKNQDVNYISDFCAAYAASSVSEDQEGVELVPEYTFSKAKQIVAGDRKASSEDELIQTINEFGLNLRDICRAACKFGFLERIYDPFHCNTAQRPPREDLADWRRWPEDLEMLAFEHRKSSFFLVDGGYDFFDNIRATLWKNRPEQRSVIVGARWRSSWSRAKGGVISSSTYDVKETGGGHAFKIFGQMNIEVGGKKEMCLIAQLSNGQNWGDKGIFYFTREVVNREIAPFGAFTFKDLSKEKAQTLKDLGISTNASIMRKIFALLWYLVKNLTKNQ